MNKRGEEAEAWVVIGILILIMIFYLVFLPPDVRNELFGDEPITSGTSSGGYSSTILAKSIGRLDMYAPKFDHPIPSNHIFEAKSAVVFDNFNPVTVKNGWFVKRRQNLSFTIPDLDNTQNVMFAFDSPYHKGDLIIKLNGKQVFEWSLDNMAPPPIKLRKDLLNKDNSLEISVGSVGLKFWRTNSYFLDNPKIIGDVVDIQRQVAQNVFAVSETEKKNLLLATIEFTPECDAPRVGPLAITINNQKVYSAIPVCGSKEKIEIPADNFKEGANTILFQTSKGDYTLNSIKITTHLKETKSFIEFFEIPATLYNRTQGSQARVMLEIDFVDDNQRKQAQLNVNGHLSFIDQKGPFFTKNLNPFLLQGSRNYIEITPETTLNIPELRVVVK